MAHWYEFEVEGQEQRIVCKADRAMEVQLALTQPIRLMGCVAREKIHDLRHSKGHTVFNSVSSMRAALGVATPELVRAYT